MSTKRNFMKGFTLAEILITIGIIGVVAAITIPNLIQKNYEKQTVAKVKETYAILAQALKMAEEEYGDWDNPINDSEGALKIAERIKPFLKIAVDCGLQDLDGKCFPNVYYEYLNKKRKVVLSYAESDIYYKIKLLNGTSVMWRGKGDNEPLNGQVPFAFFIDSNGVAKPNRLGYDMFDIYYYPGYGLLSYAYRHNEIETGQRCSINNTGYGCAYHIIKFGNMNYLHEK